jgi:calcium-dependent protein kinase
VPIASSKRLSEATDQIIDRNINDVYSFHKILGSGHFGIVREARRKEDTSKTTYAIKSIEKEKVHNGLTKLRRELQILRSVDHPNIIRLFETYEDSKYVHLVMEK